MTRTRRQEELLADRALEGLSEAELRELEALGATGDDSFDVAAAGVALSQLEHTEPLPAALAEKILAQAPQQMGVSEVRPATRTSWRHLPRGLGVWAGWAVAAVAAVAAILTSSRPPRVIEKMVEKTVQVEVPAPLPSEPTAAERRTALLDQALDATTVAWVSSKDPAARGASGDVVWSEARQEGYMRIHGLAANNPSTAQYQLWIFDGKREAAHPVDGGVFDVKNGEVVIPIDAAIRVFQPKLFAVTAEKPGGVVVSKRERIVLTAAL